MQTVKEPLTNLFPLDLSSKPQVMLAAPYLFQTLYFLWCSLKPYSHLAELRVVFEGDPPVLRHPFICLSSHLSVRPSTCSQKLAWLLLEVKREDCCPWISYQSLLCYCEKTVWPRQPIKERVYLSLQLQRVTVEYDSKWLEQQAESSCLETWAESREGKPLKEQGQRFSNPGPVTHFPQPGHTS